LAASFIFGRKVIEARHGQAMADSPAFKKTLDELKSEALTRLERRGYDVRGKTTTEIKWILRRRPTKPETIASNPINGLQAREKVQS
jgi:hypothetical protein